MAVHSLQASFNAGELTPLLDMRVGVEKYANGCRRLKNMIVSVHGPASKRAGLVNMGAAETNEFPGRLMGLNFSSTTSFVVEITKGKFRFWSNGLLVPFTLAHPYADADFWDVQSAQVNDVIYLTHPEYVPRVLERYGDTDWRLREIHQPASGWSPSPTTTPPTGNALMGRWFPPAFSITSLNAANQYCDLNPPGHTVPGAGSPVGTGNNWPAVIQRTQAWFVAPTTGVYQFRAVGIYDQCRVHLNATAFAASGAVVIIETSTPNAYADSGNFNLVAGSAYYMEFLHNNYGRPSLGEFQYRLGGVDQGNVGPHLLAGQLNGSAGLTLEGWPALLDENITATTITPSATTGNITLAASAAVWNAGHVGAWWQIAHRRDASFAEIVSGASPAAATNTGSGLRVLGRYTVYTYGTWAGELFLEELNPDGVTWSVIRSWRSNSDRNVIDTGTAEREAVLRLRTSIITWSVQPRFLLESADSKIYGLVRITAVTSPTAAAGTVYAPLHAAAATPYWTEGAWSAAQGFPRCVCLHQQRTNWGGTRKRPQSIWGSVTGDFENFRRSTFDDGSYLYQIASRKSFVVQWMLSHEDLMIGTSLNEWIASSPEGAPITPVNLTFRWQSENGSDYRAAEMVRETVVFSQRNSNVVSRLSYRENGKYGASDISILASHLFTSGVHQMAWQAQPTSVLWIVMRNGNLVGLTYEEDQNVFACHEHTTDGLFKSVAVIHGPLGDEVWCLVQRGTAMRIERMDPQTLEAGASGTIAARRCFVDAAVLKETVEPFDVLAGLDHLEGMEVAILADGAQQPSQTVIGGQVTLDPPARAVCAGLPYVSEVQGMKPEVQLPDGTAQGRKWSVRRVMLRLLDSLGGEVASRVGGKQERIDYRTVGMLMDTPPPVFSGDKHVTLESSHTGSADVIVTHDEPLPFTLCGIVTVVDIYSD